MYAWGLPGPATLWGWPQAMCPGILTTRIAAWWRYKQALRERIAFAGALGIEKIVCSTGMTPDVQSGLSFHPERSLDACVTLFLRMLELAEKHQVKLCFENCPMQGNIATSPDMWRALFARLGTDRAGLCFDPSHMVWQFIDVPAQIPAFSEKIFHVHGKDTEVNRGMLCDVGVLQQHRWWQHRLPGLGMLNWVQIIDSLREAGYDGTISIEHEDPMFGGSEEKIKQGILIARDYLSACLSQSA